MVMRMRVGAWSLWLAYTLKSPNAIRKLLPADLELAPMRLLEDETSRFPSYKLLFNAYEVDSPWMHGRRVETVVQTVHRKTKETRLVVLDCMSDTLRWNPIDGVRWPNAYTRAFGPKGDDEFSVDVRNRYERFMVNGRIGRTRPIDWRFAVEGNRECYFQRYNEAFRLSFNETQIALTVCQIDAPCITNTLWLNVRTKTPSHALVHPHPMYFDVDLDSYFV